MTGACRDRLRLIFCYSLFTTWHAIDVKSANVAYQNVIDTASFMSKNTAISLGVSTPSETTAFATGYKNRRSLIKLNPQDRMPVGSATKSITAAAVLQLVEQGKLGLEDAALPHMDALIRKLTRKSLREYLGPEIMNVTVRHLLHMTSGIGDFDSKFTRLDIYKRGVTMDLDEILSVHMERAFEERRGLQIKSLSTRFVCKPGECGDYSSTNYLLLGMILTQSSGADHWLDYDQSSFLPADVREKMTSTIFPLKGRLGDFIDVQSAGQSPDYYSDETGNVMMNTPASGAFTAANALSTGGDMGTFFRALLGKDSKIISPEMKKEMMKLRWLDGSTVGNKLVLGKFYGMGTRDVSAQMFLNPMQALSNPEIFFAGLLYGHDGISPDGFASLHAYAPKYDFGLSFILNDLRLMHISSFISRKAYDITSGLTPPVAHPLQAELENKDAFMNPMRWKILPEQMDFRYPGALAP